MSGLEGKVVAVTGGSTLIGQAVVRELHGRGACVAVADIDEGPGEALAAELGERVLFRRTDITSDEDIAAFVEAVVERFGGVDGLVNLACTYLDEGFASPRADWLRALDVNVVGAVAMAQAVHPHLKARVGAAIVNFASISAKVAQTGSLALPGQQGRDRPVDPQHGDGSRRRRHPGQQRLAGLDLVEGDGRADGRRPREDRSGRGAVPPARPRRRPRRGRPGRRVPALRRGELRHRAPTGRSTAAIRRWAPKVRSLRFPD